MAFPTKKVMKCWKFFLSGTVKRDDKTVNDNLNSNKEVFSQLPWCKEVAGSDTVHLLQYDQTEVPYYVLTEESHCEIEELSL